MNHSGGRYEQGSCVPISYAEVPAFHISTAQRHSPSKSRRQIVTARPSVVEGAPSGAFIVTAFWLNMYARFPSGEKVTSVDVQVIRNPGICILASTYWRKAVLPM